MELNFPTELFLQIKQELLSARNDLEKEKAIWAGVRNALDNTQVNVLDEQFKAEFEKLGNVPSTGLQPILQSLRELVQQGAAATAIENAGEDSREIEIEREIVPFDDRREGRDRERPGREDWRLARHRGPA